MLMGSPFPGQPDTPSQKRQNYCARDCALCADQKRQKNRGANAAHVKHVTYAIIEKTNGNSETTRHCRMSPNVFAQREEHTPGNGPKEPCVV
jgi:galactose-1-phosphate uridylyltransferase